MKSNQDLVERVENVSNIRVCFYILTALAVLYTLYFAQDLVLVLLIAVIVSLLLSPGVKLLQRMFVPRIVGAIIMLALFILPTSLIGVQLQEPLSNWAKILPQMSEQIMEQVDSLSTAMSEAKRETTKAEVESSSWFNWFDEETTPSAEDEDSVMIKQKIKQSSVDLFSQFISSTPMVIVQVLTTIVLILFILIFSQRIFLAFNTLFVASERRESAREFAESVQHQLSKYIVTVSIINVGLGFATFAILYFLDVDDAVLLGSLMGLLNFVPYIGPLIALSLVLLAGIVQWGFELNVLIPLFAVLTLNVVESQFITPGILAKNMQINPLFIILWLLVCGWFWGMLGVLIALPLLVCIKLTLAQAEQTRPWIKLLSA